jgi:integrase
MATRVMTSLRMVLAEAMRRGLVAQNVAREVKLKTHGRDKHEIEIPTKDEIRRLLAAAPPLWRPLLVTATFTGLRASELRGLTWDNVDLPNATLYVRQRADRWNAMGRPKSKAGNRAVILPPTVINTLREWRLACPKGPLNLVFPNGAGNIATLARIDAVFWPLQVACGITRQIGTSDDASPILRARYGLHALRHFYASWLIDEGFPPKRVQALLGHSNIAMTLDTYGHLFPVSEDERSKLAVSAAALVG